MQALPQPKRPDSRPGVHGAVRLVWRLSTSGRHTGAQATSQPGRHARCSCCKVTTWAICNPIWHLCCLWQIETIAQEHAPSAGTSTVLPPPERFQTRPEGEILRLPWLCRHERM